MRENKGAIMKRLYLSTLFSSHILHKQPRSLIPVLVFFKLQNTFQYQDVSMKNIIQQLFKRLRQALMLSFDSHCY